MNTLVGREKPIVMKLHAAATQQGAQCTLRPPRCIAEHSCEFAIAAPMCIAHAPHRSMLA